MVVHNFINQNGWNPHKEDSRYKSAKDKDIN